MPYPMLDAGADAAQLSLLSALTYRDPDPKPTPDPPIVWAIEQDLLGAGHSTEAIELLISAGLALRWQIPGAPMYIVLTPWGAWTAKVAIRERWIVKEVETKDGPETRAFEVPCWVERPIDDRGDPLPVAGPSYQPRHKNECRLPFPEQVVDPKAGPEYLADVESGETTRTEAKAVLLFAGSGRPGVPIAIDPRLRGKRPQRPKAKRRGRRTA